MKHGLPIGNHISAVMFGLIPLYPDTGELWAEVLETAVSSDRIGPGDRLKILPIKCAGEFANSVKLRNFVSDSVHLNCATPTNQPTIQPNN